MAVVIPPHRRNVLNRIESVMKSHCRGNNHSVGDVVSLLFRFKILETVIMHLDRPIRSAGLLSFVSRNRGRNGFSAIKGYGSIYGHSGMKLKPMPVSSHLPPPPETAW
jgi:hypothetical protein